MRFFKKTKIKNKTTLNIRAAVNTTVIHTCNSTLIRTTAKPTDIIMVIKK